MKRLAWIAVAAGALVLTACENPKQDSEARVEEPYTPLDQTDPLPAESYAAETMPEPAAPEPAPADDEEKPAPAAEEKPTTNDELLSPAGGRTYVVQPGDTLYGLARRFYDGDQSKWKVIWEANSARVKDPNKLAVGTKLIIP